MSKCGANEALKSLTEKTSEMADSLKDTVDLDKLEEFKAKADLIKGDIENKLLSQIPKPKNLQEELEKIKGLKEGLAVGAAVLALEKDFGKALGAGVLTGALKNVLDPVLQGAAGIAAGAEDAISDALGGKKFDICKNVPNIELDENGEPVEKAKPGAKPNEKCDKPKEVEKTVENNAEKPSTGGSQYTFDEYLQARVDFKKKRQEIITSFNKDFDKHANGVEQRLKELTKTWNKIKRKWKKADRIREKEKKYAHLADAYAGGAFVDGKYGPLKKEDLLEFAVKRVNYDYCTQLNNEVSDMEKSIFENFKFKYKMGSHPFFDNEDWYDKTKYPENFIYQWYETVFSPEKRSPGKAGQYGLHQGDKEIGDFFISEMDAVLGLYQDEEVIGYLDIMADYEAGDELKQ